MRLHTYAREYVRGERELTPEQLEYVEQSGKLARPCAGCQGGTEGPGEGG